MKNTIISILIIIILGIGYTFFRFNQKAQPTFTNTINDNNTKISPNITQRQDATSLNNKEFSGKYIQFKYPTKYDLKDVLTPTTGDNAILTKDLTDVYSFQAFTVADANNYKIGCEGKMLGQEMIASQTWTRYENNCFDLIMSEIHYNIRHIDVSSTESTEIFSSLGLK